LRRTNAPAELEKEFRSGTAEETLRTVESARDWVPTGPRRLVPRSAKAPIAKHPSRNLAKVRISFPPVTCKES
jgi:hypothetical protein